MKKTFIALAVIAGTVSGAAQATEVYKNDTTSIDLNGRFYSVVETVKANGHTNTDVKIDDSRLGMNLRHQANDSLALIGKYELQFTTAEDDSAFENRDAWAGFDFTNIGQLTFGRNSTVYDDFYLGGFDEYYGFSQTLADRGRDNGMIKFVSAPVFGGLTVAGNYQTRNEAESIRGAYTAGVKYDFTFDESTLTIGLSNFDYDIINSSDHVTGQNLGAKYALTDSFAVGADYGLQNNRLAGVGKTKTAVDSDITLWRAGAEYTGFSDYRIYGGLGQVTVDDKTAAKKDGQGYYVGMSYNIIPNAYVFAEYASYDKDTLNASGDAGSDKFALGLNVNF
ncbi:porin [Vibrio sp. S11_S32]|uniref:porin n=1 Tax=Vibrio sp. S11_S32 TaxID=2720225 RepID=UPI0016800BC4|nr:porin [Vibrio sp. S11_S32]MBD1575431.1 porin [Vibrio sp. S11_S32]